MQSTPAGGWLRSHPSPQCSASAPPWLNPPTTSRAGVVAPMGDASSVSMRRSIVARALSIPSQVSAARSLKPWISYLLGGGAYDSTGWILTIHHALAWISRQYLRNFVAGSTPNLRQDGGKSMLLVPGGHCRSTVELCGHHMSAGAS